jgi:replicative DNA helicase
MDLPRTAQAEPLLCATVMAKPDLLDDITVSHEDFSDRDFGLIYRTILWLYERGKLHPTVLVDKLGKRVPVEKLTVACDVTVAQPWAAQELAQTIRQAATRRRLVAAGHRLLELADTAEAMDDTTLAEAEKALAEVSASVEVSEDGVWLADMLRDHYAVLEERIKSRGRLVGVDTGFRALNVWLGGWRPGYLCVVGARPGMGKTAWALQSALAGAEKDCAVVFSVEMTREILTDRILANEAWMDLYDLMNGRIEDDSWQRINTAVARLEDRRLLVYDNPYATVPYIRQKLRRLARKLGGRRMVVFVDYLQLLKVAKQGRSRTEEVGMISTELKAIANELNCSVVALAQLNRNVESRSDKRPTLADLRDSGQIEQDADVIMFLYREEYYNPEAEPKGVAEIIVAKNRNGECGTAKVGFKPEFQRFIEVDVTRNGE